MHFFYVFATWLFYWSRLTFCNSFSSSDLSHCSQYFFLPGFQPVFLLRNLHFQLFALLDILSLFWEDRESFFFLIIVRCSFELSIQQFCPSISFLSTHFLVLNWISYPAAMTGSSFFFSTLCCSTVLTGYFCVSNCCYYFFLLATFFHKKLYHFSFSISQSTVLVPVKPTLIK